MSKKNSLNVNKSDYSLFHCLSKTGCISKFDSTKGLGIKVKDLNYYEKNNLIERYETRDKIIDKSFVCFKLTDEGKKFCKKELDVNSFYNSTSLNHDVYLSKHYIYNCNQEERQTWLTESNLRNIYKEKIDNLDYSVEKVEMLGKYNNNDYSTPDGGYYSYNKITGQYELKIVEVITKNYNGETILQKEEFSEYVECSEYITIKI